MINLLSLWLPILLSAVFVFIFSSVIHMFLSYHKADFGKISAEDDVLDALKKANIPPGDYVLPHAGSMEEMRDPVYIEKTKKGPAAFMTITKGDPTAMGGSLALWFGYSVVVSLFSAYIASRAIGPTTKYLSVFRFVGAAAFMGYSLALLQNSIWYKRKWSSTFKSMFDGLIYALITAGTFGWLWPAAV